MMEKQTSSQAQQQSSQAQQLHFVSATATTSGSDQMECPSPSQYPTPNPVRKGSSPSSTGSGSGAAAMAPEAPPPPPTQIPPPQPATTTELPAMVAELAEEDRSSSEDQAQTVPPPAKKRAARAPAMGPKEVEIMVDIFDRMDYKMERPGSSERYPHPHKHKSRVVRKVIHALKTQLGVDRTKIQIQKKFSDLQRREDEMLQRLRRRARKMAHGGSSQRDQPLQSAVVAEEPAAAGPPGPGTLEDVASPAFSLGAQEEVQHSVSPEASTSSAVPATSSDLNHILKEIKATRARMDVVEGKSRDHEKRLRHLTAERHELQEKLSSLLQKLETSEFLLQH